MIRENQKQQEKSEIGLVGITGTPLQTVKIIMQMRREHPIACQLISAYENSCSEFSGSVKPRACLELVNREST